MARPVIGICTALERARWSVWDQQAYLLPRSYVDAVQRAGGHRAAAAARRDAPGRPRRDPRPARRAHPGRRRRHRSRGLRGAGPRRDPRHGARARRLRDRAHPPRPRARPPAAGHLPRHAAHERRRGRHAAAAPAREPRPPRAPAQPGLLRRRRPRRAPGRRLAGRPRRGRGRRTPRSPTTTRRVDRVGEGFEVTGWSSIDELPEAFEAPDRRFALGVQWHPEADEESRLIGALVAEAAAARNGQR